MIGQFINWGLTISLSISGLIFLIWTLNSLKKKLYVGTLVQKATIAIEESRLPQAASFLKCSLSLSVDIGPKRFVSADKLIDDALKLIKSAYRQIRPEYSLEELEDTIKNIRNIEKQKAKGGEAKKKDALIEELREKQKQLIDNLPLTDDSPSVEVKTNLLEKRPFIALYLLWGAQIGSIVYPIIGNIIWVTGGYPIVWFAMLAGTFAGILAGTILGAAMGLIVGVIASLFRRQPASL